MSDTTPRGSSPRTAVSRSGPDPGEFDESGEFADRDVTDDTTELDLEAPEADAQEQQREVREHRDDPDLGRVGYDAAPADATEQRRVVELDEDDYR